MVPSTEMLSSGYSHFKQMASPTGDVSSSSCVTGYNQMAPSTEKLSSGYSEAEYNQMAPPPSPPSVPESDRKCGNCQTAVY